MLNKIIRVELHIHWRASKYRERNYKGTNERIVEYSDANRLDARWMGSGRMMAQCRPSSYSFLPITERST